MNFLQTKIIIIICGGYGFLAKILLVLISLLPTLLLNVKIDKYKNLEPVKSEY